MVFLVGVLEILDVGKTAAGGIPVLALAAAVAAATAFSTALCLALDALF